MAELLALWPVLLFWPAVALSVVTAGVGLLRQRTSFLLAATILVSPASLYLAATPRFRYVGVLPVVAYALAGAAAKQGHARLGGFLVAVTAGFFVWLAVLVQAE